MKLPALQGKSRSQINYGYIARANCLKTWEADSSRASIPDADYERLIHNNDSTFWIAIRGRTLAEALKHMQSIPATSDKASSVKPQHSLSPAQLQLAKKLRGERLQAWSKDPLWRKRTDRQKEWFVTLPLEWFLKNIKLHCLFDVMLEFREKMNELAVTSPSQVEEKKPVPDNEECPF